MVDFLRIGKDVCHIISAKFPHISTSKYEVFVENLRSNFTHLAVQYEIATEMGSKYVKKLIKESPVTDKKIYSVFSKHNKNIEKIERLRPDVYGDEFCSAKKSFSMLRDARMGNCEEEARVVEALLRKKGINSCTAQICCDGKDVDHVVAVFNRDGSPYNGKIINNKTIIVDSWAGIVDYANNYFSKNRDVLSCMLNQDLTTGKLTLENPMYSNLSKGSLQYLTKIYL